MSYTEGKLAKQISWVWGAIVPVISGIISVISFLQDERPWVKFVTIIVLIISIVLILCLVIYHLIIKDKEEDVKKIYIACCVFAAFIVLVISVIIFFTGMAIANRLDTGDVNNLYEFEAVTGGYSVSEVKSLGKKQAFLEIPETYKDKPVIAIGDYAFRNCDKLVDIKIPNNVTIIGQYAFSSCSGFTSITIPSSVTRIESNAFQGCNGLVNIKFEVNSKLTYIGESTFSGCSKLTSITIPDSVINIGRYAFSNYLTIYAEAVSKPSGWNKDWAGMNVGGGYPYKVIWGCTLSVNKTYVVSFVKNTITYQPGSSSDIIKAPYRNGYSFGGWATSSGSTTVAYTAANIKDAPNGTKLYAIWK